MVTSASYSLCSIREEFGKHVKFIVEVYVAMPSTQSVCRNTFTVTPLSCFMYYSVSSAMAHIHACNICCEIISFNKMILMISRPHGQMAFLGMGNKYMYVISHGLSIALDM